MVNMFDVCHHVMDAREKLGDAHAGSWEMRTREAGRCTRGKLGDARAGSRESTARKGRRCKYTC